VGLLELLGLPYTGNCPGEFYIQDDARITRKLLGFRDESAHDSNGHAAKEFRVGIIGDDEPCAFDPVEVRELGLPAMRSCAPSPFGRAPMEGFATLAAAKFRQDLLDAAVATYRTLRVRDFGLVELRVHDRRIEPVGVRTDCDLGENSELARSAAAAGICHAGLVNRIAESALTRSEQHQLARLV
jgi:hypothetical protein